MSESDVVGKSVAGGLSLVGLAIVQKASFILTIMLQRSAMKHSADGKQSDVEDYGAAR